MSTASRGDFAPAGEAKGFDYSLLVTDDDDALREARTVPLPAGGESFAAVAASAPASIDVPLNATSPVDGSSAGGAWNIVAKTHHGRRDTGGSSCPRGLPASPGYRSREFTPGQHAGGSCEAGTGEALSWGRRPQSLASHGQQHPQIQQAAGHNQARLRQPVVLDAETSIEIYDFPPEFRTINIHRLLAQFENKYRIKWNNDTSCWAVFHNKDDARSFLDLPLPSPDVKIRPYDPSQVGASQKSDENAA